MRITRQSRALPESPTEAHPPCKDGNTGRPDSGRHVVRPLSTKFICGNSGVSFASTPAVLISHSCSHPSSSSVMGHPALRSRKHARPLGGCKMSVEFRPVGTSEPGSLYCREVVARRMRIKAEHATMHISELARWSTGFPSGSASTIIENREQASSSRPR